MYLKKLGYRFDVIFQIQLSLFDLFLLPQEGGAQEGGAGASVATVDPFSRGTTDGSGRTQ